MADKSPTLAIPQATEGNNFPRIKQHLALQQVWNCVQGQRCVCLVCWYRCSEICLKWAVWNVSGFSFSHWLQDSGSERMEIKSKNEMRMKSAVSYVDRQTVVDEMSGHIQVTAEHPKDAFIMTIFLSWLLPTFIFEGLWKTFDIWFPKLYAYIIKLLLNPFRKQTFPLCMHNNNTSASSRACRCYMWDWNIQSNVFGGFFQTNLRKRITFNICYILPNKRILSSKVE